MEKKGKIISLFTVLALVLSLTYSMSQTAHYRRMAGLELEVETGYCMHINIYVQRAGSDEIEVIKDGVALDNAGVLTTIGKNWIEDQMGDSPSADPAKWISVSNDAGAPAVGWTEIPVEIAANGLTRAAGTYASAGDGVWTISYQFTATGAQSCQLTGLQWADAGDNNLLGADTFASVTLANGDKLTVTWTITVT